jgi:hypothetical protein
MQHRAIARACWLAAHCVAASAFLLGPARLTAAETGPLADPGRGRVVVSQKDCAAFTSHTPAPGVQYEPGRDARGRTVAPADLPGAPGFALPETIRIDLGIDLAEKYGLGAGGRYTGEGVVGTVTVRNGRAYLNGQPLDAAERNAIADACRRQRAKP